MIEYRMDYRTEEQFKADIQKGNEKERTVISLFKHYLKREFGFKGIIKENGIDMGGDFIKDIKHVSTGADYMINGSLLEVKTCAKHNINVYLKEKQVSSYIKQGASILYVNGVDSDYPAFTLWTNEDLKKIRKTASLITPPRKIHGGKRSFVVNACDYDWRQFNGKEKIYARH